MKTNQHTPTRSKSNRRKQQLNRDTKPLLSYEAELFWTQYNCATVQIQARSLEEANQKANELSSEDIDNWNPTSGEMSVESVQLADGGSDDE